MATHTGCIAVLNAGSSSIKFALYEAGRDGALLFHGQVEKIGLAAHLAATDATGATVAERRWEKGELDHQGATERDPEARARAPGRPSGARVRPSRRPRRHANSPRRSASMRASWPRSRSWCPWRRCTSRTISRPSRSLPRWRPPSRRSPASTPRSIVPSPRWRRNSPCRAISRRPACAATASTACPTISSCHGWKRSIRRWRSPAWSSPISAMAPACAPSPTAAASPAPWASPPSTA